MTRVRARSWLMALMVALIATPAFAQGGSSSSISGVVVDRDGGVVPGATITATNDATAGKYTAISGSDGGFNIPSLNVGKYTVTVALQGFKTAVLKDVAVSAGAPATVRATLEIGGVTETVVVEGATEIIQTQTSAASTTITTTQIDSLPLSTRNALEFVKFLPGVQTPGDTRDSIINGLPQSAINITLDGVSVQDNWLKTTDGFFARMSPRIDAVEEVTVTTAGNGADASAQGAAQIQFTTRSGSNLFTGSAYYYYQNDALNSNNYFNKVRNLPKADLVQRQPGIRLGGPVVIPGVYDGRGKLFFFFNYEEFREPEVTSQDSNFLTDEAQSGIFRYLGGGSVQSVNLYELAARNGRLATPDPTIAALLNDIRNAAFSSGTITPLADNYTARRLTFQTQTNALNRYPTVRLDYNLSTAHRLNFSYNYNDIVSRPDTTNSNEPTFPGFPITSDAISDRYTMQASLRSTLTGSMVNEVRAGRSGGASIFDGNLTRDAWNGTVANTRGYALTLGSGLTNAGQAGPAISTREPKTMFIEDRVSWIRGRHNLTFGGTFTQASFWLVNETLAPTVTFSVLNGDPALNMFSAANFPNSSNAQRNAARDLYALLVGSVSAINGQPRLDPATGKYVYNGVSRQEGRLREFDLFLQDNWRLRPNLTVNAGLRYMIQRPFQALNNSYSYGTLEDIWGISGYRSGCDPSVVTPETCNLFKAGETPGVTPTYKNLGAGVNAYGTDWNNFAPSLGLNWTPGADSGWRRTLLGETGTTSISAGYTRAFERHGMSDFATLLDDNPGLTAVGNRTVGNNNLGPLPLYFRNGDLGPPPTCSGTAVAPACIPESPVYPIPASTTGVISTFDPNLQVPYADTWTVGLQRALSKTMAFEVRYVGTRSRQQWLTYDYNELNILDNGFLNEFRLAQANLYANIAANRGATFAYMGPGTNTSPLPIYLAHFTGTPMAQAGDVSKYALSSNWSNSNYVNPLTALNPNPFTHAGTGANAGLQGTPQLRGNAAAAGLPANFFLANPDATGGARVVGNGGFTSFNGLQMQLRRRLSEGLQFDMNYAFGKAWQHTRYSFRVPFETTRNTGEEGDVTHAYKAAVVYELPFGQGRRFANNYGGVMDRIVNGWQLSATARIQSGQLLDLGNVRVNGMSEKDVAELFRLRKVGPDEMYMWPQDIIDNTIKAYSFDVNGYTRGTPEGRYFSPANGPDCIEQIAAGYGDCGVRTLVVTGPVFRTMDLTISKQVQLTGRKNLEFRFDILNIFDTVNFTPVNGVGNTAAASYQITEANRGANYGREMQLVMRFNW